ncbi:MAG TPA: SDR family oxidoreductase [Verrucomicrobiae bacterium]|nr:SDR family oxidoreductase [Verrucomicrobiae bacterium]
MRTLIIGCGYVGTALGAELARQGHEVFGVRRANENADELQNAGIKPLIADVTKPAELAALPGPFDWVVNCVSSTRGGVEEYRAVYLEGTRNLIEWLAAAPPKKFVYTSSTSVYGQTDGSAVKESSPTEPASETSRVLVETEKLLLDAAQQKKIPAVILRVAGIYGPERGHLFLQYLKNEAKIAGKGERIINMIHRDDLVGVIIAALKNGRPGEIYNAVDDEPVAQIHFFRWLSETLGKWMPPFATEEENAERKRGLTNKKVQNRRLKMELGYQFKYPNFRKGYTAEIQRLDNAGLLNIKPEPRD